MIQQYTIRLMVSGLVLHYLDSNWSGEYGLDSDDMTNQEKLDQLKQGNNVGIIIVGLISLDSKKIVGFYLSTLYSSNTQSGVSQPSSKR